MIKNYKTLLLIIVVTGLLLAGCKFQANTNIQGSGSGELQTEVGFTAQERQNLEKQQTASPTDFCNTANKTPTNIKITQEQRGDETWCITTSTFDSLDKLRQLYAQKKGITIHRLDFAGGLFYYGLDIDTASPDSSFSNFAAITWVVTLPGTPTDSNAQLVDGDTLTWTIQPKSGLVSLHAQSGVNLPQEGQFNLGPIMIAFLIVGALLALGVFLFLRRRGSH